jgi:acyl carrier protein
MSSIREVTGASITNIALLETEVIAIVREAVEAEPDRVISRQTSFLGDLETDSLSLVRIDTLLQAKLGLALAADDIETIATVGDLIDALAMRGQPVTIG